MKQKQHCFEAEGGSRRGATGLARILALGTVLALGVSGCNILDVENPNNMVEEDLNSPAAAAALANGALSTVARGIGAMAAPYSVATDELTWIGSRDAWGQLDAGAVDDYNNEFTDGAFPNFAQGRWMADFAIQKLTGITEEYPDDADAPYDLARAYFVGGLIYTVIGEIMDDFAFSDRTEPAPPVGEDNMDQVFDTGIGYLDQAISMANSLGESDLALRAQALRARAKHSKAIWGLLNPKGSTPSNPLINDAGANADAAAVIAAVGATNDWKWDLEFSSSTVSSSVSFQVNERGELQFGARYVQADPADLTDILAITIKDPIDGIVDPIISRFITMFTASSSYAPITVVSAREMHLILAEAALATGDMSGFTTHVNHVRALDGLTPYSGQIPALDLLKYERQVNLFMQLRRLQDLYRWGEQSDNWQSGSAAATTPGTMLPITIIERRANPYIGGSG